MPISSFFVLNIAIFLLFLTADVDNMRIQYVVNPNTNATSDIFFVDVKDPGRFFFFQIFIQQFGALREHFTPLDNCYHIRHTPVQGVFIIKLKLII